MSHLCANCGKPHNHLPSKVNRAMRDGRRLFCGRKCAGLARRKHKTKAQRIAEKRLYDMGYRERNKLRIKAVKKAYFQRTYDPVKAAKDRRKRMPLHIEYCRQPRYKAWKREYDRRKRASEYGPFADAYILAVNLNREIKLRGSNYEIRLQNQTLNKRQERSRSAQTPARDRHSRSES